MNETVLPMTVVVPTPCLNHAPLIIQMNGYDMSVLQNLFPNVNKKKNELISLKFCPKKKTDNVQSSIKKKCRE